MTKEGSKKQKKTESTGKSGKGKEREVIEEDAEETETEKTRKRKRSKTDDGDDLAYAEFRVWMERRFKKLEDGLGELRYQQARLLREVRELAYRFPIPEVADDEDAEGDSEDGAEDLRK